MLPLLLLRVAELLLLLLVVVVVTTAAAAALLVPLGVALSRSLSFQSSASNRLHRILLVSSVARPQASDQQIACSR